MKTRIRLLIFGVLAAITGFPQQSQYVVTNLEWVNNFSARISRENVPSAVDENGYIYTIGYTISGIGQMNSVVQKIDSNGTTVWWKTYNGTGNADDKALSVALSDSGYIYICGESVGSGTGKDFFTIKYDQAGNQKWVARYNGAGNSADVAVGLVVDASGNVYTAGRSTNSAGNFDYCVVKYNASGTQQWAYTYNGTAAGDDRPRAIVLSDSNRVFVTGYTTSTSVLKDITTIRVSTTSGTADWVKTINGSANGNDEGHSLIMDGYDPVIVGGIINSGSNTNYYIAKLNRTNGNITWNNTYDAYGSTDVAYSIALNDSGQFGVVGFALNTTYEYHTLIYSNSGNQIAANTYPINISTPNIAPKISLDTIANYFYVAGETNNGTSNTDVVVYQVSRTGNREWTYTYNGGGDGTDCGTDVAVNSFGQLFVVAQTANSSGTIDMTTFRLSQTPIYDLPDYNNELPDPKFCFYPNRGQILNENDSVETSFNYYTNFQTPQIFVDNNSYSYVFSKIDDDSLTTDTLERIEFKFFESSSYAQLYPRYQGPNRLNYYLPHCDSTGITNVKGYYKIMSPNIFPKVDLHYFSNKDGLKFYLGLKPWTDTTRLKFQIQGGDTTLIDGSGNLILRGTIGNVILNPPLAYQLDSTGAVDTLAGSASWVRLSNNLYKISLPSYNPAMPVVIVVSNLGSSSSSAPPFYNIDYSSYIGTSGNDEAYDIKVDAQKNRYIVGTTNSIIFPTLHAVSVGLSGAIDGFVQKYDSYDTLEVSTYIGGSAEEYVYGVEVSNNGNIYIGGYTRSLNFPTKVKTGATNQTLNGRTTTRVHPDDGFLVELYGAGDSLRWSRYVGGDYVDAIRSIDYDEKTGDLYVVGYSSSSNFTFGVMAPYSAPYPGQDMLMIFGRFNQNDSVLKGGGPWAPVLAGFSGAVHTGLDILADDSLFIYITGYTNIPFSRNTSGNPNAYADGVLQGQYDGFIMKWAKAWTGTQMFPNYTLFGGSGRDYVNKIAQRSNENIVCVGHSSNTSAASGFPVKTMTGAYNLGQSLNTNEAFIVEMDADFTQLWTSLIGKDSYRDFVAYAVDVDSTDHIFVGGFTNSDSLSYGAWGNIYQWNFYWDSTCANYDGFFNIFDNGNQIVHSSLFGGSGDEKIFNIDAQNSEKLYCVGRTTSTNFQYAYTPFNQGLIDSVYGGGAVDGFVSRFDLFTGFAIGIADLAVNANSIIYFPNPTTDYVTLRTGKIEYKSLNLNIYDVVGNLVISKRYNNVSSDIVIDLKPLTAGQYIFQLIADDFSKALKIIKQ